MLRKFHPSSLIPHPQLLTLILFAVPVFAQTQFSPGDWQSWRDFRGARALDANMRELYVATGGGVLVYELNRNRWEDPAVMGYGAFEAVPVDDALLLIHDDRYNYLWVVTRDKLLKWNRGLDRWEIARTNIWPLDERPVNIGIGNQSLYVETIPDRLFDGLFTTGTPIPDPVWMRYIRRYSGDRATGNLFPEMKPGDNDTLAIRWRGLRTKVPLRDSNYPPGVLGQPPAGLPMLFPPQPYTWLADGTLLDQKNRAYPMTDWLVDSWDTFWSTHWGAGVLRTELRGLRGMQELAGPAGNDIRALVLLDHEMWMAGANEGDFMGISVMENYGDGWRFIEKRDNQQIRTTRIDDMAYVGERIWFASADGLLSYLSRKKLWKRYDVQDNLPSQQITALAALNEELWVGTNDGLAMLDTRSNSITRIPNTTFELQGITELLADDTVIWVGTGLGLFQVNARSHEISQIPLDNGMLTGAVTGLAKFGTTLWATSPNGVMRRTVSGESKSWLADTWMKQTAPTCITASDPYIWIGANGGLFRFDPERESWEHYTRRDGLVDDRVQIVREDRGDLWIGTAGGLTRYYYSRPGAPR